MVLSSVDASMKLNKLADVIDVMDVFIPMVAVTLPQVLIVEAVPLANSAHPLFCDFLQVHQILSTLVDNLCSIHSTPYR